MQVADDKQMTLIGGQQPVQGAAKWFAYLPSLNGGRSFIYGFN